MEGKIKWIELAPRSFLWRTLICSSNMTDLPPLNFTYNRKKKTITVESNEEVIAITDGRTYLREGSNLFKTEMAGLRLSRLISEDSSLLFDFNLPVSSQTYDVGVLCSRQADEAYVVRQDISRPVAVLTSVRIESRTGYYDQRLMLACLAFFWVNFELDRTFYG